MRKNFKSSFLCFIIIGFSLFMIGVNLPKPIYAYADCCNDGSCSMNEKDNDPQTNCARYSGKCSNQYQDKHWCSGPDYSDGGGGGVSTCTGKCAKTGSSIPRLENEREDCTRHGNKSDCDNHGGYGCRWSEQCTPPPPPPCNPNNWGGWNACSVSCGGGTQTRTNACGTTQSQACNTQACPIPPTATPIPPTATPIPPTATPIPPTAAPTSNPCPRKSQGDANCDGKVDGIDYSLWLNNQCNPGVGQTCANLKADFNADGKVNDDDYKIWFTNRGS